jgi:hypothetical protein
MREMRVSGSGQVRTLLVCSWCEITCVSPRGWRALFRGDGDEPALVCGAKCEADVRADIPDERWRSMPLTDLITNLAAQYAEHRRSWRCTICRHPRRLEIDSLLLHHTSSQRAVAAEFQVAKGTVAQHALGHLPVAAVLAATSPRKEVAQ